MPRSFSVGFTRSNDILQNYSLDLHQKSPLFPQGPRDGQHVMKYPPMGVRLPRALSNVEKGCAADHPHKFVKLFTYSQRYIQSTQTHRRTHKSIGYGEGFCNHLNPSQAINNCGMYKLINEFRLSRFRNVPPVWKGTTQITRNLFISVLIFNTISSCHRCSSPNLITAFLQCLYSVSVSRAWWLWPLLVSASKHPYSLSIHHQLAISMATDWFSASQTVSLHMVIAANACSALNLVVELALSGCLRSPHRPTLTTIIHLTWCASTTQIPTFNRVQHDEISF